MCKQESVFFSCKLYLPSSLFILLIKTQILRGGQKDQGAYQGLRFAQEDGFLFSKYDKTYANVTLCVYGVGHKWKNL